MFGATNIIATDKIWLLFRIWFSFTDQGMGRNVIIFEADMSSSVHVDLKNKDLLILGERPTQGVDGTTSTA